MSAPDETGTFIIPATDKLVYKSELFDVIVRSKHKSKGLTRDRFIIAVELLDQDPLLERVAVLDIPEDIWRELGVGEKAKARLYEHPDHRWLTTPPTSAA